MLGEPGFEHIVRIAAGPGRDAGSLPAPAWGDLGAHQPAAKIERAKAKRCIVWLLTPSLTFRLIEGITSMAGF